MDKSESASQSSRLLRIRLPGLVLCSKGPFGIVLEARNGSVRRPGNIGHVAHSVAQALLLF